MKKIFLLILITTPLFFMGCPGIDKFEPDSTIIFHNNSSTDILRYFDFNRFPDTTIIQGNPFSDSTQYDLSLLPANQIKSEENEFVKILEATNNSVMIYLFSKDTIDQVPWERIQEEYLILKRYDLSLEDLEAMNWTITYPWF